MYGTMIQLDTVYVLFRGQGHRSKFAVTEDKRCYSGRSHIQRFTACRLVAVLFACHTRPWALSEGWEGIQKLRQFERGGSMSQCDILWSDWCEARLLFATLRHSRNWFAYSSPLYSQCQS